MSEPVIMTFMASGIILGCAVGYVIGWQRGIQRGKDEQWMADFFGRIEKEKQRRDKLGRFKKNQVAPSAR